jgi:hypothetical protein
MFVMKTLFLLLLLVAVTVSAQKDFITGEAPDVHVLAFKWNKTRLTVEQSNSATPPPGPMAAMIPQNKIYARTARINDPAGARDPNDDTVDGRAAKLEKSVQDSRTPPPKTLDGFSFRVKMRNASSRAVETLFWEYQFIEKVNPSAVTRRQFLCLLDIRPEKEKEVQAFALFGPADVISVAALEKRNDEKKHDNPFHEKVVINRVEYSDGVIWQRKSWSFGEIRAAYKRALATPWANEMCRGL